MPSRSLVWLASTLVSAGLSLNAAAPENDLDAFMKQVVARRDDNWKKLQQYIFDEREQLEMRGPNRVPIWGERREYTWYIRDGFFVRSPTKFNGVTIGDAERRTFEAAYLKQAQERDKRAARGSSAASDGSGPATDNAAPADASVRAEDELAQDLGGVI